MFNAARYNTTGTGMTLMCTAMGMCGYFVLFKQNSFYLPKLELA
ncbi:hypothetical protein [Desulfotruncus alcoholivorax]|nr:hypothetical protein [Desulfotruncus alcoholivorax]